MSPAQSTTKRIFNIPSVITILVVAFLYICFAAFLMNYRLVITVITGSFPLTFKLTILSQLVGGIGVSLGRVDSMFLFLNGILVGLNIVLIVLTIQSLEGMGKVKLSVGGATLIGLVAAGCGACGFTIFSLLGVSTSLSFLPFHGSEIHILSFLVLAFSSWYMIRKLIGAQVCRLY